MIIADHDFHFLSTSLGRTWTAVDIKCNPSLLFVIEVTEDQCNEFQAQALEQTIHGLGRLTSGRSEKLEIVRNSNDSNRVRIKASNGFFLQHRLYCQLLVRPDNASDGKSVFVMTIAGGFEVTNGYGPKLAPQVMRSTEPAELCFMYGRETFCAISSLDSVTKYYKAGDHAVRKHSSAAYVVMSNSPSSDGPRELFPQAGGLTGSVIDVHYYNLFSDVFNGMRVQQNIDFIHTNRPAQLNYVTTAGLPKIC
ncbi:hypothetical protein NC651_005763 [Populus alba x Populus x berolinensis]|nr:hypothetical protein NC651_005763 [Populus alba x Populus x berolinensis]